METTEEKQMSVSMYT